ncbi:MAG: hypothetical protein JOZ07_14865 [Solirubrobacterales bacterium]|nr:hypothetical protein [Solirubrobacterales bacterium]
MTALDHTLDPDGRRIELTIERWAHIVSEVTGHPELARYRDEVLRAVTASPGPPRRPLAPRPPDEVQPGRRSNERWFFLRGAGPSRWLQVVVAYEEDRGWIVTAFGRRRDP